MHGAFVDETSWNGVATILTAKGYTVTAVKNPLTSLADDVAATKAALDAQDGPAVLVGHSEGGVVIGEAGDNAKVSALVYVSAFAPDKGESITALSKSGPATEGVKAIHPDAKGYLTIDPAVFPSAVAGDLPKEIGEHLAAHQMPINHTAFDEPAQVAWHAQAKLVCPQLEGHAARPACTDLLCRSHEGQGDDCCWQPLFAGFPRRRSRSGYQIRCRRQVSHRNASPPSMTDGDAL